MTSQPARESVIAAWLADPTTRSRVSSGEQVDWAGVLATLNKNNVPLISLADEPALTGCPLVKLGEFRRIAGQQREAWRSLREEYGKVRAGFLERGIQSILFKSVGLAPSFPYTSDNLDTLVRPEHTQACREILNQLGFVELRNIEEPQKLLFRKFEGGVSVSAIHLHGTVGWGVPFVDDAALWTRARVAPDDPLVLTPGPEDALLATIAHAFYENKSFKLLDVARIRHCLKQPKLNFPEIERIAAWRGWEDGLAFCLLLYSQLEDWLYGEQLVPAEVLERARRAVKANAWLARQLEQALKRPEIRFPFRLSFIFGKIVYYRKVVRDPQRSRGRRLDDVIRTLVWGVKQKLRIRPQRGMIVSLSGIDGSGKTVHARALVSALQIAEIKAHTVWSRFGSSAEKTGSGRPGPEQAATSDTATSLDRRRQRLRNPIMRLGWLICNLAGLGLRYNWQVRLGRCLGHVVVCDRYTYDAAVEISASLPDSPGLARWAERLLIGLSPRPDVAWLLDVPADVTVARQADENLSAAACEELARHREAYLAMARAYGLKVLETRNGQQETTSRIVRETMLKYYDGYRTWLNALFLSNPNQMNPQEGAR
ncbi:MAG TPA: nucleotidyltransferase family protein [bacterium]|nr:nucleotidyltransferase family protein [bacterium]